MNRTNEVINDYKQSLERLERQIKRLQDRSLKEELPVNVYHKLIALETEYNLTNQFIEDLEYIK